MPFGAAAVGAIIAFVLEPRMIDRDVLATVNLQASGIASQVDRKTATALGLATDRAVAALIRVGVGTVEGERHRAAVAGSF
ncbi:hypothetical protein D3C84_922070 [compost metagenome]